MSDPASRLLRLFAITAVIVLVFLLSSVTSVYAGTQPQNSKNPKSVA